MRREKEDDERVFLVRMIMSGGDCHTDYFHDMLERMREPLTVKFGTQSVTVGNDDTHVMFGAATMEALGNVALGNQKCPPMEDQNFTTRQAARRPGFVKTSHGGADGMYALAEMGRRVALKKQEKKEADVRKLNTELKFHNITLRLLAQEKKNYYDAV